MMTWYFLRSLKSRAYSLLFAVFGLGVAVGAVLAVARVHDLMSSGYPVGTNIGGEPVSIFMHSSAMKFDFFLSPRQIQGMQEQFADSGQVLGSSGTRSIAVRIDAALGNAYLDVVSPNFFDALGIELSGPAAADWGKADEPVAVVSARLLARLGLDEPPTTIEVGGHLLRVAAVTHQFNGLWDQFTEIWVDWRLGPSLLFPSTNASVEDQPWFYWTLAIPQAGQLPEFHERLRHLAERRDLAEPPFDGFRLVPGITNQPEARRLADDSVQLYLSVSLIALLAAAINLACWSALARISKAGDEWTMLCLGLERGKHARFTTVYIIVPVFLALSLGVAVERGFTWLIAIDPSVDELLSRAANLRSGYPWKTLALTGLGSALIGLLVSSIVTRSAGLRFGSSRLAMNSPRLRWVFGGLTAGMSFVSSLAMIVGYGSASSSMQLQRDLSLEKMQDAVIVEVRAHTADGKRTTLDADQRHALLADLSGRAPEVRTLGLLSIRPYSAGRFPLTGFSLTPGGDSAISVLLNQADADALDALNVRLLAGRELADIDPFSELLLDAASAATLARVAGVESAIGLRIYDSSSMPYSVAGVVTSMSYTADVARAPSVAYMRMDEVPSSLHVALNGKIGDSRLAAISAASIPLGDAHATFAEPLRVKQIAEQALTRYRARISFCMAAAATSLLVAVLAIASVVLVQTRQRLRQLAIMRCLGADLRKIAWSCSRGIVVSSALGSGFAALMVIVTTTATQAVFFSTSRMDIWETLWPLPFALVTTLIGALIAVGRELGAKPLYAHLKAE